MIFTVVSTKASLFGQGKLTSKNRFEIPPGFSVFFYDSLSVEQEFAKFVLASFIDMEEPVKFMKKQSLLKCIYVICNK